MGVPPTETPPSTILSREWETLAPGLERRAFETPDDPLAGIIAVRLDPSQYDFRAHYRAGEPQTIGQWRTLLPGAALIINANFFDPAFQVLGLVISDGTAYGQPYRSQGGSFASNGTPVVFSNIQPGVDFYAWQHLVQGFPMLVENGSQAYTSPDRATRRTAIGIDTEGRVIVIVSALIGLALDDLSALLAGPEFDLVNAVNLDGGGSTMMWLPAADFLLVSRDAVPTVLAAYPRK
jgi:hypothetical protein